MARGGRNAGPVSSYSGTGGKVLGEVKLNRDVVLHWIVSGGRFSLTDASHRLHVTGVGARGQGFAAAGDYMQVRVTAVGRWVLHVQLLSGPR